MIGLNPDFTFATLWLWPRFKTGLTIEIPWVAAFDAALSLSKKIIKNVPASLEQAFSLRLLRRCIDEGQEHLQNFFQNTLQTKLPLGRKHEELVFGELVG